MPDSILVVDDEREIADLLELYLQNDGYRVLKHYSACDALASVEDGEPELAILDVMLPDMSGFELCRRIRERHVFPIIMLSARVEDMSKITGLTLGADDYVTKPFNPLELLARVKTQLRRCTRYNTALTGGAARHGHDFGGLSICRESRKCLLYGREVPLTPIEFDILWYLCEHRGRVVPAEELFEAVWGERYLDNNNTVMAHMARLREKLGESRRRTRLIRTVWGVGYTIDE